METRKINIKNNKAISIPINMEHVWGNYRQLLVNDHILMRCLRVYEEGTTSLHKHNIDEIIIIESGSINCYIGGKHNKLEKKPMQEGDCILISRGTPHKVEYVSGVFKEDGKYFAQVSELCLGNNLNGKYLIHRLEPALPARKPRVTTHE